MSERFHYYASDLATPPDGVPPLAPGYSYRVVTGLRGATAALRLSKSLGVMALFHAFARRVVELVEIRDRDGRLAHYATVTGPDFRFPFMGRTDVIVGGLWTEPEHRGRGIAKWMLGDALRRHAGRGGRAWYVVAEDNEPSIRVAVASGMERLGGGIRSTKTGLPRYR